MSDLYLISATDSAECDDAAILARNLDRHELIYWPAALTRGLPQLRLMASVSGLALTGDLVPSSGRLARFTAATRERGFVIAFRCKGFASSRTKLGIFWRGDEPAILTADWLTGSERRVDANQSRSLYVQLSGHSLTPPEVFESALARALTGVWGELWVGTRR